MALATRCPNCHALFRVVADQLKLRGGLVRCGACQHVFDAIGTLSYIDDSVLATPAPPEGAAPHGEAAAPTMPTAAVTEAAIAPDRLIASDISSTPDSTPPPEPIVALDVPVLATPDGGSEAATPSEEAARAGLVDATAEAEPAGDEAAASRADDAALTTAEAGAPAFLRDDTSSRRRSFSVVFGGGSVLLAMVAQVQLAVLFRSEIIAHAPSARPLLTQVCRPFGCTVDWPARGDLLAVVGSELQSLPGTGAFELTAVVRNRGSLTLALPAIELTLTDTLNRTVARKVFLPQEYLARESDPAAHVLAGLEPGADLTIRIAFEAGGLNAAGFVVYPFYL